MKKKIITLFFALALLVGGLPISKIDIVAEENRTEEIVIVDEENIGDEENAEFEVMLLESGRYVITGYRGNATDLVVPSKYNGKRIIGVEPMAFSENNQLKTLTFEEGYEYLNYNAISGCNNLEEINIPGTMKDLSGNNSGGLAGVFSDLDKLVNIHVSIKNKNYKDIDGVLYSKNQDRIIRYPSGRKDETYNIAKGVKYIGTAAFECNDYLKKLHMPDTVISLACSAISHCYNLEALNISKNCEHIGQFAIMDTKLESITVPKSVKEIDDGGIVGNDYLKEIKVEKGNTNYYVRDNVMYGKVKFNVLYFNGVTKSYDGIMLKLYPAQKEGESFVVPDEVKYIDMEAFERNSNIRKVDVNQVEDVGIAAFFSCYNLSEITLSYKTELEENVFVNVDNLTIKGYENRGIEKYIATDDGFNEFHKASFESIGIYQKVNLIRGESKCVNSSWSSLYDPKTFVNSNSNVADLKLNDNMWRIVTAKKVGQTYIECRCEDGYTFVYDVNVSEAHVKKLTLDTKTATIYKGEKYRVKVEKSPSQSVDKIKWSSSNKKVATVSADGMVTGKKAGKVTITAKSSNGVIAKCTVKVKEIRAKSVKLNKKKLTIKKGKTKKLKIKINPYRVTDTIKWYSSNKKIATVDKNGKVKAKRRGTVTIKVKTSSGKTAKCKVIIK